MTGVQTCALPISVIIPVLHSLWMCCEVACTSCNSSLSLKRGEREGEREREREVGRGIKDWMEIKREAWRETESGTNKQFNAVWQI